MSQFTMIAPSYSIEAKEPSPSKEPMSDATIQLEIKRWIFRDSVVDAEMTREKPQKGSWLFGK